VAWLQEALAGGDVAVKFTPYSGALDGIFGPMADGAVRAVPGWACIMVDGIVGDDTWFIWMTPGLDATAHSRGSVRPNRRHALAGARNAGTRYLR
jgi:peptidoglycan hydrolase-like protein with peptidoglycan-binding domain